MNLPWHMACDQAKSEAPILFELADGRFQVVSQGTLAPVLGGFGYLLVEKALANFLAELEVERITFQEAVLVQPVTGEEIKTYDRIRVSQFFTRQDIQDLALVGLRMLTLNDQYYFVSTELKAALEQGPFPYLRFSEGLSGFGASAA